jgi:uncharacterized membrane protein
LLAYNTGVYNLLKFLHISGSVAWVGTGFAAQVLVARVMRANDPPRLAALAKDIGWMGKTILAPLSGTVALLGIVIVIYAPQWSFGDTWILIGILGFLVTAITGSVFLGPESERLGKLVEESGPDAPGVQERISRILMISRVDLVVLFLVIADMVFKPGS